jgi:hypothetical protein
MADFGHEAPDLAAGLRQALRAQDDQGDHQDDEDLRRS